MLSLEKVPDHRSCERNEYRRRAGYVTFIETVRTHGRRNVIPAIFGAIIPVAVISSKAIMLLLIAAFFAVLPAIIRDRLALGSALREYRSITIAICLLLTWGMLSAVWSIDPAESVVKALKLTAASFMGGIIVIGVGLTSATQKQRIVNAIISGIIVALCFTALRYAWIHLRPETNGFPEGLDPISALNPGLTVLAVLFWPVMAELSVRSSWKTLAGVGIVLASLLAVSTSGSAVLAVLMGAIGFTAAAIWPRVATYVIAFVLFAGIVSAPFIASRLSADMRLPYLTKSLSGSAYHRVYIWEFAAEKSLSRPVLGWGLASSRAIPGGSEKPPVGTAYLPLHPHHAGLQIWLELGGVGALLAGIISVMAVLRRQTRHHTRLSLCVLAGTALSIASVAFTAYSTWQSWWVAMIWLTCGILVGFRPSSSAPPGTGHGPHDA